MPGPVCRGDQQIMDDPDAEEDGMDIGDNRVDTQMEG
jgi:hypothetical protein